LRFHGNHGCLNVPQYYDIRKLYIFLKILTRQQIRSPKHHTSTYFYKFSVFHYGDRSYFGFLGFKNAQLSRLTLFNDFLEGQIDVHFDTVCSPEDGNSMFLLNGRVNLCKHIPPKPRRLQTDQTHYFIFC
jgi:hypothetical protein